MWRFFSLFSSIAMGWRIVNSCHKIVRSVRNTTLKLWSDCTKKFIRNAQNCGKTNNGFCTMMTSAQTSMLVREFLGKRQNRNQASTTLFPRLGPRWFFLHPKSGDIDERQAFCYDWGDKRKLETGAVGDTKKRVSEVFRGLFKNACISVLYLRGVILKGTR